MTTCSVKRQQELAAASAKLAAIGVFLVATWLVVSILSFNLMVPTHDPGGYGVTPPLADEGDEADEL
jgi:hypothetical protein